MKNKNFYTPKEYAKITGLHLNTVYNWIDLGNIETLSRKKNCKYLIPAYELPTYLRAEKGKNE